MLPAGSKFRCAKDEGLRSLRKSPERNAPEAQPFPLEKTSPRQRSSSFRPGEVERRCASRYHVLVSVTFCSEDTFYQGLSENLSEGGLFVATHAFMPIDSIIDLSVTLPGMPEPVVARGRVRWLRDLSPTSSAPPGMGVQFTELDQCALVLIRQFIKRREPRVLDH